MLVSNQGSDPDEIYMQRCLDLAIKGRPDVRTNPLVGCCIVHQNRIIGEGYHAQYGEAHAEVQALNSIKPEDRHYLTQSRLYVTLAPCNHHGKTPPCVDAVLNAGIPCIIIGTDDTTTDARGGIEKLKAAGLDVRVGVLESKAQDLIRPFLIGMQLRRPHVTIKWAESTDGFIGRQDERMSISSSITQLFVHDLRRQNNGILIGAGTAIIDNPSLTTRRVPGINPLRIVITGQRKIPLDHKLLMDDEPLLLFHQAPANVVFTNPTKQTHQLNDLSISSILAHLYADYDIGYLLVEGGAHVLAQFIENDFWDECYQITSQVSLQHGVPSPNLSSIPNKTFYLGEDRIDHFINSN